MKKPKIDKLKYPLWFTIVFYILTVVCPIILVLVQGFKSNNSIFKWSFSLIALALLVWIFVKKFIIKNKVSKIETEKASLEHDYQIDVGSKEKIKWLWFSNELQLAIFNLIDIALLGGILVLIAIGLQTGCVKAKASSSIIALLYIIAYTIKIILIITSRDKNTNEASEENNSEVKDGKQRKDRNKTDKEGLNKTI